MKHGTQYAYKVKRCKCDTCRDARNKAQRDYVARRRLRQPSWRPGMRKAPAEDHATDQPGQTGEA